MTPNSMPSRRRTSSAWIAGRRLPAPPLGRSLVLGSRWVHQRADRALADAAANVLAKIGAVLPKDLRETLDDSGMLIAPGEPIAAGDAQLPKIRQAIRTERKIGLSYRDKDGAATKRTIWPFAVGFFEKVRVVVA